jgi:hypothetical protein
LIIGAPSVIDLSGINNLAELDTKKNGNAAREHDGTSVARQWMLSPDFSETYLLPDGTEPLPGTPFFTTALVVVGLRSLFKLNQCRLAHAVRKSRLSKKFHPLFGDFAVLVFLTVS